MGQKVSPLAYRLGYSKQATARWYAKWFSADSKYSTNILADVKARQYLEKQLLPAGVAEILIERTGKNAKITISAARPGVVIGRKGTDVDKLKQAVSKIMNIPVHLTISEVRKPDLEAKLVAESIAQQLERRVMFRRAMKRAVSNAMRLGAEGIKVKVSGRLGGAEIARTEWYKEGRVPLHTLRADIDYGTAVSSTTYGVIGVKVWIFKGELIGEQSEEI